MNPDGEDPTNPIFDSEPIAELAGWAGLTTPATRQLMELAAELKANPGIDHLAQNVYAQLFDAQEVDVDRLPATNHLGDRQYPFHLLLLLAGIPATLVLHRQRGVPQSVSHDTIGDIAIWAAACEERFGLPGIERQQLRWITSYLKGKLFRIGRLQYRQIADGSFVHAFRERHTGEVVAVCAPGLPFTTDGLRADEPGREFAWESCFTQTADGYAGHRVTADGRGVAETTLFRKQDWTHVLRPAEPMLEVHIPAGPGLTREALEASFSEAEAYFCQYYPDRPFRGFSCRAWLLDPQLRQFLKPTSNILAFQDQFVQRPTIGGDEAAIERIFGREAIGAPVTHLPRTSSLQQAVADFMAAGGRLRIGSGFRLRATEGASR